VRSLPRSRLSLYHELAKHYDAIYSFKDYRAESSRLESIARRYGRSGGTDWLDVACGTGKHLEFLRRAHAVMGVDGSLEMLRVARRRLPGVTLRHGDMRTFRIAKRFDVVSCLFSAIGHLRSESELLASLRNFSRHLKPGGVVIVEPWIEPSKFRTGMVHVRTFETTRLKVVRCALSSREGNHSLIEYHYLIAEAGRGIRHIEEKDRGLLVSHRRLLRLMTEAGLRPRFLSQGFTGERGLLIGVKAQFASGSTAG
jgi:SAM-dependent methyltransferase